MGAEPAQRRKQSLTPLQPAPRAPVAAFGAQDIEGDDTGLASYQRGDSPQTNEQGIAFSLSASSVSADAIAATLAGYGHLGIPVQNTWYRMLEERHGKNTSPVVQKLEIGIALAIHRASTAWHLRFLALSRNSTP